jgi:hypothetical protein
MFQPNPFNVLGVALADTVQTAVSFLPNVIIAIVVFALGWIIGSVLSKAVSHVVGALKIDNALHKAGMDTISEKAGVRISVAGFFGGVVNWIIIIAFTIASAEILGLTQVTSLLRDILVYIPQVMVAAIVLVMAALVADFVANIVAHSVKATGINAQFAATVSRWSILIVGGVVPALTQLRIAQGLVEVLFTGVVFAISLAVGLSFGLGGRDAAARVLEKMKN